MTLILLAAWLIVIAVSAVLFGADSRSGHDW
ncbi:MAG: hypothetical protein QOG49_1798 [Frankiaceae bacterium]|jgi:hypothetical protein|nr:hypothetical protein [Frankiaceae bacterium]